MTETTLPHPLDATKDPRLSYGARGLLFTMLTAPSPLRRNITFESMIEYSCAPNGRDSTRKLLKELINCGYVKCLVSRDKKGRHINTVYKASRTEFSSESPEDKKK